MAVPCNDRSRARLIILILLFLLRMVSLGAQLFLTGADPPPTRMAVARWPSHTTTARARASSSSSSSSRCGWHRWARSCSRLGRTLPRQGRRWAGAMAVPRDDRSRARLILLFSLRTALLGVQLFSTGAGGA